MAHSNDLIMVLDRLIYMQSYIFFLIHTRKKLKKLKNHLSPFLSVNTTESSIDRSSMPNITARLTSVGIST